MSTCINIAQTVDNQGSLTTRDFLEKKKPSKVAYIWLKVNPKDPAFHGNLLDEDRQKQMIFLEKNFGYEVKLFNGNIEFFKHIEQDSTKIDLLFIAGHGSPWSIEDAKVINNKIISSDKFLTKQQQNQGFEYLGSLLNNRAIVILDACMTGIKSVENNFAKTLSMNWPQSTIFAFQTPSHYEPRIQYSHNAESNECTITGMNSYSDDDNVIQAVQYAQGHELTCQDPSPLPYEYQHSSQYMIGVSAVLLVGMGILVAYMFTGGGKE